jgi:hypothetical protein
MVLVSRPGWLGEFHRTFRILIVKHQYPNITDVSTEDFTSAVTC